MTTDAAWLRFNYIELIISDICQLARADRKALSARFRGICRDASSSSLSDKSGILGGEACRLPGFSGSLGDVGVLFPFRGFVTRVSGC